MKLLRGVVEDNLDPLKIGRVKVRVLSLHSEELSKILTDDLPWSEVMGSTSFGLISGIGASTILHKGTWVWLLLEEDDPNKLVILGTITGVNSSVADTSKGFNDPDGEFPLSDRSTQSDINSLSRGLIENNVVSEVKNASLDVSEIYTEVAQVASEYTDSQVIESKAGHIFELDDTSGNERVQIIDKQGNYSEMKLDEYIDKAVKDKINIVMRDLKEHIVGNSTKLSEGTTSIKTNGAVTEELLSTRNITVTGAVTDTFNSTLALNVSSNMTETIGGNATLTITGDLNIVAANITMSAGTINLN